MSVDNITRRFTSTPIGLPISPGGPILLGFPILWTCPAKTHNSLHAAREYPKGQRCVCPWAIQRLKDHRAKNKASRRVRDKAAKEQIQQHAVEVSRGRPDRKAGEVPSDHERVRSTPDFTRTDDLVDRPKPLCRITELGGTQPAWVVDSLFYGDEVRGDRAAAYTAQAKAICRECPLQVECLLQAVENREPYGVWGGLDAVDRNNPSLVAAELSYARSVVG